MNSYVITLRDLAELEHSKNMNQVHLCWTDSPSLTQVLPILKRCTNLRRITLNGGTRLPFPSSEELCEFIMNLKHLTFLHIIYGNSTCNHFKSEVDQVKALVFPRRPNFTFYVSCFAKPELVVVFFLRHKIPGDGSVIYFLNLSVSFVLLSSTPVARYILHEVARNDEDLLI